MEHKITKLEIKKNPKEKTLSLHGMKINDALGVMLNTPPMTKKDNSIYESEIYWSDIPFPRREMDCKTVEFEVLLKWEGREQTMKTGGDGTFLIHQKNGKYHVEIICLVEPPMQKIVHLTGDMAKLIKKNPQGSKFDFSLNRLTPEIV